MDRFRALKRQIFDLFLKQRPEQMADGMAHLAYAGAMAGLIALRRGLNPELCQCAGWLHDLWLYLNLPLPIEQHRLHGVKGAELARALLAQNGGYSEAEVEQIAHMIELHDDKLTLHDPYAEALKEADACAHVVNDSDYDRRYRDRGRAAALLDALENHR